MQLSVKIFYIIIAGNPTVMLCMNISFYSFLKTPKQPAVQDFSKLDGIIMDIEKVLLTLVSFPL